MPITALDCIPNYLNLNFSDGVVVSNHKLEINDLDERYWVVDANITFFKLSYKAYSGVFRLPSPGTNRTPPCLSP